MTPEEFTQKEDEKALQQVKKKLADALDGEEVIIAMTGTFSMLRFLVETHCNEPIKTYKNIIKAFIDAAKKHKEKK